MLQALTKNKLLEPTVEKRLNAAINTWIRTPFGTIGGYILFIQVMYNGHEFSYKENLACLTVGGLVAWNALFFGRRVPTAALPSPDCPGAGRAALAIDAVGTCTVWRAPRSPASARCAARFWRANRTRTVLLAATEISRNACEGMRYCRQSRVLWSARRGLCPAATVD